MIGYSVAPAFFVVGRLTGIVTVYDAAGLKVDPGLQYTVRTTSTNVFVLTYLKIFVLFNDVF